jgi:membrane-bound metal-dependent hydrolase YbcI (DUF457 family)
MWGRVGLRVWGSPGPRLPVQLDSEICWPPFPWGEQARSQNRARARQGTHSLLAVLLVAFGVIVGVHSPDARWVELGIAFLSASLLFRVLLGGRGLVCVALAAATAAALVTIAPEPGYFAAAIIVGYISHIFPGDFWTVDGIPSILWPLDRKRRMRFPLLGHTDGWREHAIASACGLLAVWLLVSTVFMPAWKTQTAEAATPRPTAITRTSARAPGAVRAPTRNGAKAKHHVAPGRRRHQRAQGRRLMAGASRAQRAASQHA